MRRELVLRARVHLLLTCLLPLRLRARCIYYDNHDRADVVKARTELLKPGGLYQQVVDGQADESLEDCDKLPEYHTRMADRGARSAGDCAMRAVRSIRNDTNEPRLTLPGQASAATETYESVVAYLTAPKPDADAVQAATPNRKAKVPALPVIKINGQFYEMHCPVYPRGEPAECALGKDACLGVGVMVNCDFCEHTFCSKSCIPDGSSDDKFHLFSCHECLSEHDGAQPINPARRVFHCSNCKEPFHTAATCDKPCVHCEREGHTQRHCPSRKASKASAAGRAKADAAPARTSAPVPPYPCFVVVTPN